MKEEERIDDVNMILFLLDQSADYFLRQSIGWFVKILRQRSSERNVHLIHDQPFYYSPTVRAVFCKSINRLISFIFMFEQTNVSSDGCSPYFPSDRRKRSSWGQLPAADESTCGAVVSVWGSRAVNVGQNKGQSDEGSCDPGRQRGSPVA